MPQPPFVVQGRSAMSIRRSPIAITVVLFAPGFSAASGCIPPQVSVDCSYCASTTCSCSKIEVAEMPVSVTTLPFTWSKYDSNSSNDTCSGSETSCNCNAGTTTYTANTLTAPSAACTWSDNKQLPATITCKWKDGSCTTQCSNWVQKTCCQ